MSTIEAIFKVMETVLNEAKYCLLNKTIPCNPNEYNAKLFLE